MAGAEGARSKAVARARFRAARDGCPAPDRSRADALIAQRLLELPELSSARLVLAYSPIGSEVDVRPVVRALIGEGRAVALPRTLDHGRLAWYEVRPGDVLECGALGVPEPAADEARRVDPYRPDAVALVPGIAFDARGARIGYGGGYYDRFLAAFPGTAVGLARESCIAPDLCALGAVEEHDVPVEAVLTERRLIRARRAC